MQTPPYQTASSVLPAPPDCSPHADRAAPAPTPPQTPAAAPPAETTTSPPSTKASPTQSAHRPRASPPQDRPRTTGSARCSSDRRDCKSASRVTLHLSPDATRSVAVPAPKSPAATNPNPTAAEAPACPPAVHRTSIPTPERSPPCPPPKDCSYCLAAD